ncbi:hypothetical protein U9M48_018204 [Paspalum notatum var. saurae]|uniref:Uncharacterized protein n=1 Tax=Paspalum notatum var. saurae TaxID=547442 RepID=A0AAQ3WPX2_PASNO
MASDDAADRAAALALLSGPEIVALLRTTHRRADYDAAARVLAARDARLAEAHAALLELRSGMPDALAEIKVLREQHLAFKAASRGRVRSASPSGGGAIAGPAPWADRSAAGGGRCKDAAAGGAEEEGDWEDGEFRPGVAGVSSPRRKESAPPEGGEGRGRAGVSSCKRKAPASACSSDSDDEDDGITLSQLMKKLRGAEPPVANGGGPKKGGGGVQGNSAGPLGVDRAAISPVNRGGPEATAANQRLGGSDEDPKAAVSVQGKGNGRSGEDGGLHRAMPCPLLPGSAVGIEMPEAHIASSLDGTISMVPKATTTREQVNTTGGGHKTKVSLGTDDGIGEETSMILRAINEQGKPNGQVLKENVLPGADVIEKQDDKLSPCHSREVGGGGKLKASAKPVSAVLKPKNQLQLHSEQTPVESSLPSVSRHWKSASDLFASCLQNKELCMQATCALHRQGKFGCIGLTKFDAHRASLLADFLLDGNLEGPMKRTVEELSMHDSTGHDLLERVVLLSSEQLYVCLIEF